MWQVLAPPRIGEQIVVVPHNGSQSAVVAAQRHVDVCELSHQLYDQRPRRHEHHIRKPRPVHADEDIGALVVRYSAFQAVTILGLVPRWHRYDVVVRKHVSECLHRSHECLVRPVPRVLVLAAPLLKDDVPLDGAAMAAAAGKLSERGPDNKLGQSEYLQRVR